MAFCAEKGIECVPSPSHAMLGFAASTKDTSGPINGIRHPISGNTSGWYIWKGEELSAEDDFFEPLHVKHIVDEFPELIDFLGLPPGWRFLVHGEYHDVWFDASLLDV